MDRQELTEYAQELLQTAMYKLGGADAEDLVQETMLAALLAIEQGKKIADPRAWLHTVLNRKYYDFLRQKYRRPTISMDVLGDMQQEDEQLQRLEQSEEAQELRHALAHQTRIHREVLVRYYMHGESVGQIAQMLQIPENTVKSRLYTGRSQIRKEFTMENYTKQSYAPETLHIAITGETGINGEPFNIGNDMMQMNLLILAYDKPVTLRELAEAIGIPIAYIEPAVEKLVEAQLMKRTGDKVYTDFIIYREKDRTANVKQQRQLADELYRQIWEVIEQGLQKLREQVFYQNQRPEAKRMLESLMAVSILQDTVRELRSDASGERVDFADYPDRPGGGKWYAMGFHYEAFCNDKESDQQYRRYWIDGAASCCVTDYDGQKEIGIYAYDCLLGHTYQNCYQWGILDEAIMKMLYLVVSGKEKEMPLLGIHCLEHVEDFIDLGLLTRGENGYLECPVPVISRADQQWIKSAADPYGAQIIGQYRQKLMKLMQNPVKLPAHLTSVLGMHRYMECCACFGMMVAENARQAGLFLPGYDGPSPAICLIVDK